MGLCADGCAETIDLFEDVEEGGCCVLEVGDVLAGMILEGSCRGRERGLRIRHVRNVIVVLLAMKQRCGYLVQFYRL